MDRSQQDPLGRSPLLHMEMILFVARARKAPAANSPSGCAPGENWSPTSSRPPPGTAAGLTILNPTWAGALVLALEDGFRLHRLIDPETTPADSFFRAIGDLQRAMGISSA